VVEEIILIRIAEDENKLVELINEYVKVKDFELSKLINMSRFHFDTPVQGYYRLEFRQLATEWVKEEKRNEINKSV
jgi:hypothetical protein